MPGVDHTIVSRRRLRLTADSESIPAQSRDRPPGFQPWYRPELRILHRRQIQYRFVVAVPVADKFCLISQRRNKVKRPRCVKSHRALPYDVDWIGHIEGRKPGTVILFDIEKCPAVNRVVEEHRFTSLPRQYREVRWRDQNHVPRRI